METHQLPALSSSRVQLSRESLIGVLAGALTVGVMAVEQVTDPGPGLVDPIGFAVSIGVLVAAAYLFVVAVPRIKSHPGCGGVAAPLALAVSLAAVPTMFVALPFGLSAAAVALGLLGRRGPRGRLADTAIVIGVLVTAAGARIPGLCVGPPRRSISMQSHAPAVTAGRVPVSRETVIGLAAIILAVVTMAFDHLVGSDPGLEDPVAFVITVSLSLALWGFLFGRVIPRTKQAANSGETAATRGLVCGLLAVFPGLPTMFVGLPIVWSAGAIALGLLGRDSSKSGRARAAIVIGALVLALSLWYLGLTAWSKD